MAEVTPSIIGKHATALNEAMKDVREALAANTRAFYREADTGEWDGVNKQTFKALVALERASEAVRADLGLLFPPPPVVEGTAEDA